MEAIVKIKLSKNRSDKHNAKVQTYITEKET